jgi:hypothetical protein
MPVILRCLVYDRNLGAHSVGAHVRDAACYLLWGLARAYDPTVLSQHTDAIAKALLVVACFDREVRGMNPPSPPAQCGRVRYWSPPCISTSAGQLPAGSERRVPGARRAARRSTARDCDPHGG